MLKTTADSQNILVSSELSYTYYSGNVCIKTTAKVAEKAI